MQTRIYRTEHLPGMAYAALGLAGEAGEVANEVKRVAHPGGVVDQAKVAEELGDVLWYAATLATELGLGLDVIAQANLRKLRERHAGTTQSPQRNQPL